MREWVELSDSINDNLALEGLAIECTRQICTELGDALVEPAIAKNAEDYPIYCIQVPILIPLLRQIGLKLPKSSMQSDFLCTTSSSVRQLKEGSHGTRMTASLSIGVVLPSSVTQSGWRRSSLMTR
jgi:hypothetical protein